MSVFVQYDKEKKKTGCSLGLLVMSRVRQENDESLRDVKQNLEEALREQYQNMSRNQLKAVDPMAVYVGYYKEFGYSYHVLGQLESVIKGKHLPNGHLLVDVMFMAELKHLLLTAAHDWKKIKTPLTLACSDGTETYTTLSGKEVTTVSGDLMISDKVSVISSILRGPDRRTCVDAETREVAYTVYAPPGIEEQKVWQHLHDLENWVRLFSPEAETETSQVVLPGAELTSQ